MTIAYYQDDILGPKIYSPEGPYGAAGSFPLPGFKPGDVIEGDAEAEFVFLLYDATAGQVMNQGDALCWDNSYRAILTGSVAAATQYPVGTSVGTFFTGGRVSDPAAAPAAGSAWSYTFPTVGTYGIWVQRSGTSLLRTGTVTSQATGAVTVSTATIDLGTVAFAGAGTHSNTIQNIESCLTSIAFTATTVSGSALLSVIQTFQFLAKGQTLSGTGIPNGSVITDIGNGTVTMSLAATASGSGVSITAANGSTWANTTLHTPVQAIDSVLTGVTSIAGLYPNQIITGTGIASGAVITKIQGNNAPWTVTMSLAATATSASPVNVTVAAPTTAAPNYLEAFLRWPQFNAATT